MSTVVEKQTGPCPQLQEVGVIVPEKGVSFLGVLKAELEGNASRVHVAGIVRKKHLLEDDVLVAPVKPTYDVQGLNTFMLGEMVTINPTHIRAACPDVFDEGFIETGVLKYTVRIGTISTEVVVTTTRSNAVDVFDQELMKQVAIPQEGTSTSHTATSRDAHHHINVRVYPSLDVANAAREYLEASGVGVGLHYPDARAELFEKFHPDVQHGVYGYLANRNMKLYNTFGV